MVNTKESNLKGKLETVRTFVVASTSGAVLGALIQVGLFAEYHAEYVQLPYLGTLVGTIIGLLLATIGQRPVSVFWFYLVLIFAIICVLPWYPSKADMVYGKERGLEKPPCSLPLGTAYVNHFPESKTLFAWHTAITLLGATSCTLVHKLIYWLIRKKGKKTITHSLDQSNVPKVENGTEKTGTP